MPHPEHAVDALTGSSDGLALFESMARARGARVPDAAALPGVDEARRARPHRAPSTS